MPLMVGLRRRRLQCYIAFMLCDIAALFFSFGLAGYVYMGEAPPVSLVMAQLLLSMRGPRSVRLKVSFKRLRLLAGAQWSLWQTLLMRLQIRR